MVAKGLGQTKDSTIKLPGKDSFFSFLNPFLKLISFSLNSICKASKENSSSLHMLVTTEGWYVVICSLCSTFIEEPLVEIAVSVPFSENAREFFSPLIPFGLGSKASMSPIGVGSFVGFSGSQEASVPHW